MDQQLTSRAVVLRARIDQLEGQVEEAKRVIRTWVDASTKVSLMAAEARAKNQTVAAAWVALCSAQGFALPRGEGHSNPTHISRMRSSPDESPLPMASRKREPPWYDSAKNSSYRPRRS